VYQVLYRKWRPAVFDDVYGQPHVTKTLRHEVGSGKLSHAYLFTGSRGTGKTTCARILAKAVNCLSPVDGNPCLKCEMCLGIDNGSVLDVTEIDAASNNGVDNIRELREEANFTPVKAKYRVYIIDEVHMLSIGAFNALLKILEEPPDYVIFILATTEVHKLPSTILSRCQRFDFKHISPESISECVRLVADGEGIRITDEAVALIARVADGALRDALSLLDRCSADGTEITAELAGRCAGIAGKDYLFGLADCIAKEDAAGALRLVGELHNESCGMERLCTELIGHFRNLTVVKTVKKPDDLIVCSAQDLARLREQTANFTAEGLFYALTTLENTSINLKRGFDQRTEIEMAMIRLCVPELNTNIDGLIQRVAALEGRLTGGAVPQAAPQGIPVQAGTPQVTQRTEPKEEPESQKENEVAQPAADAQKLSTANPRLSTDESFFAAWPETLERLNGLSKPLSGVLVNSSAYLRDGTVYIKSGNAALESFLRIPSYYASLTEAISQASGQRYAAEVYKDAESETGGDPLFELVKKIDLIGD